MIYLIVVGLMIITIGLAFDDKDRVKKAPKKWLGIIKLCFGLGLSLWLPNVAYFTLTRQDVPLSDGLKFLITYPGSFIIGMGLLMMIYGKTFEE